MLNTLKSALLSNVDRFVNSTKPLSDSLGKIKGATMVNTPKFSLETHGVRKPVKVIDVYDGDTIVVAMEVFSSVSAFRLRLAHINTPELKPPASTINRDDVIIKAKSAKEFLARAVLGKIVYVEILGFEKYGRLLAEVYMNEYDQVTVNQRLLKAGHATPYEGGKE